MHTSPSWLNRCVNVVYVLSVPMDGCALVMLNVDCHWKPNTHSVILLELLCSHSRAQLLLSSLLLFCASNGCASKLVRMNGYIIATTIPHPQ